MVAIDWAGRKTLVHRAAGESPAIFHYSYYLIKAFIFLSKSFKSSIITPIITIERNRYVSKNSQRFHR